MQPDLTFFDRIVTGATGRQLLAMLRTLVHEGNDSASLVRMSYGQVRALAEDAARTVTERNAAALTAVKEELEVGEEVGE